MSTEVVKYRIACDVKRGHAMKPCAIRLSDWNKAPEFHIEKVRGVDPQHTQIMGFASCDAKKGDEISLYDGRGGPFPCIASGEIQKGERIGKSFVEDGCVSALSGGLDEALEDARDGETFKAQPIINLKDFPPADPDVDMGPIYCKCT